MGAPVLTSNRRCRIPEPAPESNRIVLPTRGYNLTATLTSGQSFRWKLEPQGWTGVIGRHWVRLLATSEGIQAETTSAVADWKWLTDFLQSDVDLGAVLATFPADEPLRRAMENCQGLRLLRQEPWEALASFILSSTKRIAQIQRIVDELCRRFGNPLPVPAGEPEAYAFPSAARLAQCTESELRQCKMGFRAPNLLATARLVAEGRIDLTQLVGRTLSEARSELIQLPGVGRKIADCVLLFAYGHPKAFPVDVWVLKALQELYFPGQRISPRRLQEFSESHFGPNAGYAQQYLFHYMRTRPSVTRARIATSRQQEIS